MYHDSIFLWLLLFVTLIRAVSYKMNLKGLYYDTYTVRTFQQIHRLTYSAMHLQKGEGKPDMWEDITFYSLLNGIKLKI